MELQGTRGAALWIASDIGGEDVVSPPVVSIIGAGSWGTTVASLVAANTLTTIWARSAETVREIERAHTNSAYLPGESLHPQLRATTRVDDAVHSADVLVMAIPSSGFRAVLADAAPFVRPMIPVVSLTKGLELGTGSRMTQVVAEVLPGHPAGVLSGPNIAKKVVRGLAAAAVVAMPDQHIAQALQGIFRSRLFRVYTSTDVVGAELGGALKNVVAIAAGMAQGFGAGDNTRATVIARSLAEMSRLGVAMGGRVETFAGLAGMGDLIATCISPHSRNRYVGEQLAGGRRIEDITEQMNMVAEGVKTSSVVAQLADEHDIDMPISREVYRVTHGLQPARTAFRGLLRTLPTTELAAG
jgi:glycerol-3-phosphate dehydrogenase (NAD(P)+)